MSSNNEQLNQLYGEWKQRHQPELSEKLGENETEYWGTFLFGVKHALLIEVQNVQAIQIDMTVQNLQEGSFTLSDKEWEAVRTYIFAQTYLTETWETE